MNILIDGSGCIIDNSKKIYIIQKNYLLLKLNVTKFRNVKKLTHYIYIDFVNFIIYSYYNILQNITFELYLKLLLTIAINSIRNIQKKYDFFSL